MTRDIRISGQGREESQDPPGQKENLARFRRGRRAGDLVRGTFLRLETGRPGTAWINFEGSTLLAALPQELIPPALAVMQAKGASSPPGAKARPFPLRTGDLCFFHLQALDPEPVLRMLNRAEAEAHRLSLRV